VDDELIAKIGPEDNPQLPTKIRAGWRWQKIRAGIPCRRPARESPSGATSL